ncbi:ThiF family adenylyltransferase [Pediococcus ethanolidurans]
MATKSAFRQLYPMLNKDKLVYRFGNTVTRVGTDDNDVLSIRDPTSKWYYLLTLLDGNTTLGQIYDLFNKSYDTTLHDILAVLAKLEKENAVTVLKHSFASLSAHQRFNSDLTYYFSEGLNGGDILKKMSTVKIAVLGAGGGGSQIVLQLANMGVKHIHVVDPDNIDESNLNRQFLFTKGQVGQKKVDALSKFINDRDSSVDLTISYRRIRTVQDALHETANCDWAFCALDEPPYISQRIVNRACYLQKIPSVYAFSSRDSAKLFFVHPGKSGCADCLLLQNNSDGFRKMIVGLQSSNFTPMTPTISPNMTLEASWIVRRWLDDFLNRKNLTNILFRFDFNRMEEDPFKKFKQMPECPTCGESTNKAGDDLWKLISIK